jgi:uncharacterized protein (TIGR02246 family)
MAVPRETGGDEVAVRGLYRNLLAAWDRRDAATLAAGFAGDGLLVGFDGSMVDGRAEIQDHLAAIFAAHKTPAYVAKVRTVRFPAPDAAILQAVTGLVPDGASDLNPALNAVQTLVAARQGGKWRIVLFQNTPAVFHGRPEEVAALTEELRRELAARS